MKTIKEHNDSVFRSRRWRKYRTWIKCPTCGEELIFKGLQPLMTYPPQKRVFCRNPTCGYEGTVFV